MVTLALVEEREKDVLKGENGRGSYVDIGEHMVLGSHFLSPLCIASSAYSFP